MNKILILASIIFLLASCGSNKDNQQTESTEDIETAIIQGRGAARRVINRQFDDSMAFQSAILEANAGKSKYQMQKKPKCEAAFDSAFLSTIRTVRPDLAKLLEKK